MAGSATKGKREREEQIWKFFRDCVLGGVAVASLHLIAPCTVATQGRKVRCQSSSVGVLTGKIEGDMEDSKLMTAISWVGWNAIMSVGDLMFGGWIISSAPKAT